MTGHFKHLLEAAESTATQILRQEVKPIFFFHNLEHTQRVVKATAEIMSHYKLTESEAFALLTAAWFHDTGFSTGNPEGHESESIKIATKFLLQHNAAKAIIALVASNIAATRLPQAPSGLCEKILCDADLFHLGTPDFPYLTELLRLEREAYSGKKIPRQEWDQSNIVFLTQHTFFTAYCQAKLTPQKQHWIQVLQNRTGQ